MAKIKAVLDQETWVEVDVPDEFQAIVTSFFCSEELISENPRHAENNVQTSSSEVIINNDGSLISDVGQLKPQQKIDQTKISGISTENLEETKSIPLSQGIEKNKADTTNYSAHNNNSKMEHGKSTSHTLMYKGVGYHMVNWLVFLFLFLFYLLYF